MIEANGRGSEVRFERSHIDNSGHIEAERSGEVTFDRSDVDNSSHGAIEADGRGSEVRFDRDDVDNSGRIGAGHGGEVSFDKSHVDNHYDGKIEANGRGSELTFERDRVNNWGEISATWGGFALFEQSWVRNARGGAIEAEGSGSEVKFDRDHVDNSGRIEADHGGEVEFARSYVDNSDHGTIEADGSGSKVRFEHDYVDNDGTIQALHNGAVYFYRAHVDNTGGLISATGLGSTVDFDHTYVTGGQLTSASGGLIVAVGGISTLKDLTITSGSEVDVDSRLELRGTIHNLGTISVNLSGLLELVWSTLDGGLVSNHHTVQVYGIDTMEGGLIVAGGDLVMESGAILHIEDTVQFDGVHVDNGIGAIIVDFPVASATLVLEDGTVIDGGSLTVNGAGTLDVEHGANPTGLHGAVLDGVIVSNSGAIEIGASGTAATLTLDDGTAISGPGSLKIKSGSTLDVEQGAGSGAHGASLDGIAVTATAIDSIAVGQTSTATLALKNGTSVTGGKLTIGAAGGIGTVDVEGAAGATLDGVAVTAYAVTDTIEIAQTGTSTLLLGDGTSIEGGSLVIGASGHTGTVDVETADGATFDGVTVTSFATADAIEVGQTSASILVLENGTSITGGSLAIGATGHTGTVDVESATGATFDGVTVTAFDATDTIEVGQATTSTLLLKGGTSIARGSLVLGAAGGTIEVESAAGATFDGVAVTASSIAESIEIGQTGPSTLLLKNGTSVSGTTIVIGAAGSTATVDVESAAGATLDNVTVRNFAAADGIEVGQTSTSTLLLKDGTRILGGSLGIGAAGHIGTVDVETAVGARFDGVAVTGFANADVIEVGQTSTSTLLLENGTSIAGGSLVIGASGHTGTVDVESAAGATLDGVAVGAFDALNVVEVAQTGASTLVLKDGTSIANATLLIGAAGNTGTVDVESAMGATFDAVTVTASGALNTIEVGQTGDSTLSLTHGSSMKGGTLALGSAAGTGTVDFEGTSVETLDGVAVTSFLAKGTLEVGQTSAATLLMNDGTSITGGALVIGASGHTGTVDVESASGATLDGVTVTAYDATDTIQVGQTGTSKLLLKDGTTFSNGTLALGAGGTGTVNVESLSGATLHGVTVTAHDVSDGIEIGKNGVSTLTMDGGTTMTGGTLTIDTTGTLQVDPSLAVLSGVNLVNHGNIIVDPGTAQLTLKSGTVVTGGTIHVGDDGTLEIDNSTLTNVNIANAGIVDIGAGDTFSGTDTLTFVGAAELDVEAGAQFNLTLAGIDTDDTIDLKGVTVTSSVWDGNKLFINGSQLGFTVSGGLPSGDTFAFKSDGHGGTDLKVATQLVHVTGGTPGTGTEGSPIAIGFNTSIDRQHVADVVSGLRHSRPARS